MNVLEQAERALNYWEEGSMWWRIIQRDINANDLEALKHHVHEADGEMFMQEQFAEDFMKRILSGEELVISHPENWPVVPKVGDCEE